tara:strand:- start:13113 stop:14207 length:1095 start_codon:yes stop_codon:yes gene_type:complete
MLSYKEYTEDILRFSSWYLDYYLFNISKIFKKKQLKQVNNIIIIDLKYIGDLIIETPMIRALKQKFPKSKISIIVPKIMKDVLKGNPNIHNIIPYDKDSINKLLKQKFDLGILLYPGNKKLSSLLKKISYYRIGIRRAGAFEPKGYFLDKKTKPCLKWKHKLEDNLDVIKTLNIKTENKKLELYSNKNISQFLRKNKISQKDFVIVIHPKPQHKTHEWFEDRFSLLADKLIKKYKAKIIFTGSEKDSNYINNIIKQMKHKAINSTNNDIPTFFSIIKRSNLVISVDTSAMHVAAAFNKKTIALFGAGNPKVWHPYCDNYRVIFKDKKVHTRCWKHKCYLKGKRFMECMKSIQLYDVLKAVDELM